MTINVPQWFCCLWLVQKSCFHSCQTEQEFCIHMKVFMFLHFGPFSVVVTVHVQSNGHAFAWTVIFFSAFGGNETPNGNEATF